MKVNGKLRYLWRAVDHEGEVLEVVVTAKRDKAAALKLLKRIMKKYGAPRSIVTDGLRAYSAAMNEIGVAERHEVGGRLNSRAENSHQPFRRREQAMQRVRSMKTLQKFSSVHAQVHNQFNQERHLVRRQVYKQRRSSALAEWRALAARSPLARWWSRWMPTSLRYLDTALAAIAEMKRFWRSHSLTIRSLSAGRAPAGPLRPAPSLRPSGPASGRSSRVAPPRRECPRLRG